MCPPVRMTAPIGWAQAACVSPWEPGLGCLESRPAPAVGDPPRVGTSWPREERRKHEGWKGRLSAPRWAVPTGLRLSLAHCLRQTLPGLPGRESAAASRRPVFLEQGGPWALGGCRPQGHPAPNFRALGAPFQGDVACPTLFPRERGCSSFLKHRKRVDSSDTQAG